MGLILKHKKSSKIIKTEHLQQKKIIVTNNHIMKLFSENFYDTLAFSLSFFFCLKQNIGLFFFLKYVFTKVNNFPIMKEKLGKL